MMFDRAARRQSAVSALSEKAGAPRFEAVELTKSAYNFDSKSLSRDLR
jgi:hypothetical protein